MALAEAPVNVAFPVLSLDVSLDSRLPAPVRCSEVRELRLGVQCHQTLFDYVVTQAREHGLVHALGCG